jgi:hypothetical protein
MALSHTLLLSCAVPPGCAWVPVRTAASLQAVRQTGDREAGRLASPLLSM